MSKNKSVHCIECTKVIFVITETLDAWKNISMVIKCAHCKTLQQILITEPEVKREIKIERLD